MSKKYYYDRLIECMQEHRRFEDMAQQSLSGKAVVEKRYGEFELLFDFKLPTPSYMENLELGVLAEEMIKLET